VLSRSADVISSIYIFASETFNPQKQTKKKRTFTIGGKTETNKQTKKMDERNLFFLENAVKSVTD